MCVSSRGSAAEDGETSFGLQRTLARRDHLVIVGTGAADVLADRAAVHGDGIECEQIAQALQHSGHATRVVQIFHHVRT